MMNVQHFWPCFGKECLDDGILLVDAWIDVESFIKEEGPQSGLDVFPPPVVMGYLVFLSSLDEPFDGTATKRISDCVTCCGGRSMPPVPLSVP